MLFVVTYYLSFSLYKKLNEFIIGVVHVRFWRIYGLLRRVSLVEVDWHNKWYACPEDGGSKHL
jgi:hypothetical protein